MAAHQRNAPWDARARVWGEDAVSVSVRDRDRDRGRVRLRTARP